MGFACQSTRPLPQSGIGDDVISVPACEMISGELWDHSFALTALSRASVGSRLNVEDSLPLPDHDGE
jgi:hypothetical protein